MNKSITSRFRLLYIILFVLIFIFGSLLRLPNRDRSLWLDEAWVANSVLTSTFGEMIYYDSWLQTSPPLFLLILRWVSHVFKGLPETLRYVPALFGILSISFMMLLCGRLLQPIYASIAMLLFTFSPELVELSQSLKQYSSDVFAAIILLLVAHQYLVTRRKKDLYVALLAYSILGFLSYQSIFFIPIMLYAATFNWHKVVKDGGWRSGLNIKIQDIILIIAFASWVSLTNYVAFITPNINTSLKEFWRSGFFPGFNIVEIYSFYSNVFGYFIAPFFFISFESKRFGILILVLFIIGLWGVIWQWQKKKIGVETFEILILIIAPVLTVLIMNLPGAYPLNSVRTSIFLFPSIVLLFSYCLQSSAEMFIALIKRPTEMIKFLGNRKTFLGFLIFFALIFMLAMKVKRSPSSVFFVKRIEDVRGAMAYLLDECKEKDILYIHSSMHEQFKLYADVYRISSKVVIHGNIGWPCCPREDSNDRFLKTAEFMPAEINRLIRPEKEYRIRFLFTDRFNHWKYLRRNDPENFNKSLEQIGCAKISSVTRYRNVRIDEYLCKTGE